MLFLLFKLINICSILCFHYSKSLFLKKRKSNKISTINITIFFMDTNQINIQYLNIHFIFVIIFYINIFKVQRDTIKKQNNHQTKA